MLKLAKEQEPQKPFLAYQDMYGPTQLTLQQMELDPAQNALMVKVLLEELTKLPASPVIMLKLNLVLLLELL